MGFAIAGHLADLGAQVILICGPVSLKLNHPGIQRVDVISADQMFEECIKYFQGCDGAVMTAAVADYAPVIMEREKIKRQEGNLILELRPNRDIAATLGVLKRPDQVLVGFALESQNEVENALSKLKRKNLDLIVLNSLQDKGAGFGFDTNKISILTRSGETIHYPLKSKQEVAKDIVDCMVEAAQFMSER